MCDSDCPKESEPLLTKKTSCSFPVKSSTPAPGPGSSDPRTFKFPYFPNCVIPHLPEKWLGFILAVFSAFAFSIPPVCLKYLSNYDPFNPALWGGIGIVFSGIVTLIYTLKISSTPKTCQILIKNLFPMNSAYQKKAFGILLLRGLLWFGLTILTFLAVINSGSIGDASAIMYPIPVPVLILSYIFFKESIKPGHFGAIILLLCGIFVIFKPEFIFGEQNKESFSTNSNYLIGLVYALIVLVLNGVENITLRFLRKIDVETVLIFTGFGLTLFCLISIPIYSNFKIPQNTVEWISALGLAFSNSIGLGIYALSLKYAGAFFISFTFVLQVVLIYIWEVLFFGVVADYLSILGALLIISSVVLVSAIEYKN